MASPREDRGQPQPSTVLLVLAAVVLAVLVGLALLSLVARTS